MDRDKADKPAAALGTRPNGRVTSPFVINTPSQRKKLFAPGGTDENVPLAHAGHGLRNGATLARPASSGSSSDAKTASVSSSNTKIPRPTSQAGSSHQRRPFSLTDAFRVAEREEEEAAAAQASPSPAPRSWRTRRDNNEGRQQGTPSQRPAKPDPNPSRPVRLGRNETSSSVESFSAPAGRRNDAAEIATARELARKASDNSLLEGNSPARTLQSRVANFANRISGRKGEKGKDGSDRQQPDKEAAALADEDIGSLARPAAIPGEDRSPSKSFAWQADTEFTAGDLQVSTSPPVKLRRSNTKIDEIRALEEEVDQRLSQNPKPRPRNTKIDEIRALEVEAALEIPDEPVRQDDDTSATKNSSAVVSPRSNRQTGRNDVKIDEIRAREIESLSRRALATARLDEIRERNAQPSLEVHRVSSRDRLRDSATPNLASTPPQEEPQDASQVAKEGSPSNEDSREILQRLARAANRSPAPARTARSSQPDASEAAKGKKAENPKGDTRLTVGFAGLRREPSMESSLSDRSNRAHSDSDPTDRIEGEMKLFAPREDYSEKGSLRAPSPDPGDQDKEEGLVEETPRPPKPDPLSQPTPRVVGAYVDTPATVKVTSHPRDVFVPELAHSSGERYGQDEQDSLGVVQANKEDRSSSLKVSETSIVRGRGTSHAPRNTKQAASASGSRLPGRASSDFAHRRARSVPRTRSPLINSVKPPTVRDDLLAIHRNNQVEDSTLDDFEEFLGSQDGLFPVPPAKLEEKQPKIEDSAKDHLLKELEAYDRMNKSLQTGLLGIRTAKQGIERLEDKVAHVEAARPSHAAQDVDRSVCPSCTGRSSEGIVAYIHVPIPRLWSRQPTFRLTFVGAMLLILSCWYIAESAMCSIYCKPDSCYAGQPCTWSHDDPYWGTAIPVKLDQWTTGGRGRSLVNQVSPDFADWMADVWDAATGADIATADTGGYNWSQKQQHRRRLLKKGLLKGVESRPEDQAKYNAWRAARLARETAESARAMGYEVEDETMTGDEEIHRR
ncbi:hypothetical protein GQ53DRAFT_748186 [Thozetella sp. PMI_491]|nr:hypothetical protein GQ53DRAFT_748186 [Thozetella sp. PMI_491]